jgi:hypothetical protein
VIDKLVQGITYVIVTVALAGLAAMLFQVVLGVAFDIWDTWQDHKERR